jgi:divalent metal cation (Fe/Co/Zn/Cd) transporter
VNVIHRAALVRRGLLLEYLTLGWNVAGVFVLAAAAYAATSVALAGFGLDSLIEIFASTVVVWQLTGTHRDRERPALRLIGLAFVLLVLYIIAQLAFTVLTGTRPAPSTAGIAWTAATFAAMLLLASGKRATGRRLDNPVLLAEGLVTLVDAYLAGAVLVGLALNAWRGWWWADPAASLVIVYYGIREAAHALGEAGRPS